MSYLITQMWLCLLIASLLGAVIGYWLAKYSCRSKLKELEADWQKKLKQKKSSEVVVQKDVDTSTIPVIETVERTISKADQTSYEVEEVEGIGNNYGKKLRDKSIATTQQLLDRCCDLDGQIEIANHIGIEDFVIRKWASMSDLMRVSGIEGQFAELMVYAGIDSVQDLGQRDAGTLYNLLSKSNEEQKRVKEIPDITSLEIMITQAAALRAIMQDI